MSSGVSFETFPNAWLSVITSFGFFPIFSSVFFNSLSFTTIETAPASKISRMVCCWGRMSRPLGAALSIGTTKTTKSEGSNRSDTSGFETASVFAAFAIVSFNSVIPAFVRALTPRTGISFIFSGQTAFF